MVKSTIVVMASALATVAAARGGGAVRKTIKLDNNREFRHGDKSTEAMLRNARPYFTNRRRLQDEGEGMAFDGSYNLKFSQCVDVRTYDESLFGDENVLEDVRDGKVAAVKSYVLFHVCQSATCDYDAVDDLFVIDLPTYLKGVAQYHANKRSDYCAQCEVFADTCNAAAVEEEVVEEAADEEAADDVEEGEQQEQADENNAEQANEEEEEDQAEGDQEEVEDAEDADGAQDEVNAEGRALKQAIDCAQCSTFECFVDDADLDDTIQTRDELDNSVSEWIAELASCKRTGVQSNGIDLYMSAMCTPYGDGVELAVFLDDACTLYTTGESVYDVWDPNNDNVDGINYLTYAEGFIKSAFSEATSCLLQEFVDPNEIADEEEDAEEMYQMNDYCMAVLDGGVADFNNCEADVAAQEDTDDQFNWYKYDLKGADDINQVCAFINQKEGAYTYNYNSEASGTWYARDKNGAITSNGANSKFNIELSPAIIGGIVAFCIILIGGIACLVSRSKKATRADEAVYKGGVML